MITNHARRLREVMTDAETKLWKALRRRQVDDLQFRRQHAVGNYVVDFYCPSIRLAIEIDGGQHNTSTGQSRDAVRTEWLNNKGIAVLRYWNNDVLGNLTGVMEDILRFVENHRRESPPPERGRSANAVRREGVSPTQAVKKLTPPRRARSQVSAGCVNLPAKRADPPLSGEGEKGSAS